MKPLFISSLYHPNQVGGAEKIVRIVAEGMRQQGHDPVVVTVQQESGHRIDQVNGVKVHYLGLKNLYWPWAREERSGLLRAAWHGIDRHNVFMARAVGRVLDLEKPDIVNSHQLTGLSCAVWGAVKARRLPLVHTLHDYSLMCPKTTMFRDGTNCQGQCATCKRYTSPSQRLSDKVDHVIGVSRFTLDRHLVAGYFQRAQARVIHNALPKPAQQHPLRPDPARPLQLGYVGQLLPSKGIAQLIEQMRTWDPSRCQLVVAGKGAAAYESALRATAPPNVRFLGFVDPGEVYRAIDVLVVPSLWQEPFATTVLEACMHGVPAIVSNRGGFPEAVEAGRTGLIYEPLQPQALREAIEVFLRDRSILEEMHRHVRNRASYFQLERMQDEYLHVMTEAQAGGGAGDPSILRRRHA
ncbi:glycosyltransferase family 4 protein [Ramlibacter solisilvae]|uniref:glycosyltransferase family 4 protein n=1 Tax=Ramlibacter tataouinensis TaxID=94132 RepID=UPI000776E528|nr:glycosyltransferase family 4 protein [Ramlibacter tataouinensis]